MGQMQKTQVDKTCKFAKNREKKKKKDWSEYSEPRSGKDEIREVGGGQIRAFLGRDKNFILREMESYLRLHDMYLPIWTAAFARR